MRVLILGGDGMLGHRLLGQLAPRHETRVTLHRPLADYGAFGLFDRGNAYDEVELRDPARIAAVMDDFAPEAVVNAAGIVKQRAGARIDILSMEVNALLPHLLARLCRRRGARLIHLSTDCVFSGEKGNYSERDAPDPVDVYGHSKLLGEAEGPGIVTLRTSMIGPELGRRSGLLEWFLSQRGKMIKGYQKAVFSGFTTAELARLIEGLLARHPGAAGLYHAASAPISKLDLLTRLDRRLKVVAGIAPDATVVCDRSLDASRFRAAFGYTAPAWDIMLDELALELPKAPR